MTKIKNNPILKGASGMLGDVIVYRQVKDGVVMANKPKSSGKVTPAMQVVRDNFKKATNYAKRQMEIPASKAEYELVKGKSASAYAAAVRDFLKAPVIDQVDLSDYQGLMSDKILILASDDTKVISVTLHKEGKIILKKLNKRTYVSIKEVEASMVPMERK